MIRPCYHAILDFEQKMLPFGDPNALLFEHFLAWIDKIMQAHARLAN